MTRGKEKKGLRCPRCGSGRSAVLESRDVERGSYFRRRRCAECGVGFGTMEVVVFGRDEELSQVRERVSAS